MDVMEVRVQQSVTRDCQAIVRILEVVRFAGGTETGRIAFSSEAQEQDGKPYFLLTPFTALTFIT
jgi:hypothetical protein